MAEFKALNGIGVATSFSVTPNPLDNNYMVGSTCVTDSISGGKQTVSQLHSADQQVIPGTAYSSLQTSVSLLVDSVSGLDNRQREAGQDNVPPLGIMTSTTNAAMKFQTTCSQNLGAGVLTMTLANVTGTIGSVTWTIKQGTKLIIDSGASQEMLSVSSVNIGSNTVTFTSATVSAHNGSVTPFNVTGFTFNMLRDAAGENDGATGNGTAVAVEYRYNGGDPSNGSYDRARNINGKQLTTQTISSGSTAGSTSIVLAANTGLQPGMKIMLRTASFPATNSYESVNVAYSYVPGSNTVPLATAQVGASTYTTVAYDTFTALGAGVNAMTPFGIGLDSIALTDPVSGLMYMARMAPGSVGALSTSSDGTKLTYRYAGTSFSLAATPTDIITIQGSASRTGRIKRIALGGIATTAGTMPIQIIRRSTANTGGTSSAFVAGKHDTGDVSPVIVPILYSVNPTGLGTTAGVMGAGRLYMGLSTGVPQQLIWDFSRSQDKAIILRGTSDFISINGVAAAVPAGGVIDIEIEIEEDNS